jgi:hypothetical protein
MRGLAAVIVALLGAAPALACPLCESETGQQVRANIFDEDFGRHLLLTLLPFSVLLGTVALIHFGFPWDRSAPRPSAGVGAEDN